MTQTPASSYLVSRLAQANGQPLPKGEVLAVFKRRDDALAAFDVLSGAGFPITALYLINEGVKQVEYPLPQRNYARMLFSALIWGTAAGLGYAALFSGGGDGFIERSISAVPLSVGVFLVWTIFTIRRIGKERYPMHGEAIPERTTLYALAEYASAARVALRGHHGFAQAMQAAHTDLPPLGLHTADTVADTPVSNVQAAENNDPNTPNTKAADKQPEKKPAAQRYGLRIDDPEEYAKTIRPTPKRETPKPRGVHDEESNTK